MKSRFIALSLLVAATPIAAHDFWVQPNRFQVAPRTAVPFTFQVGHAALRQRWGLGSANIVTIHDVFGGKRRDLRSELRGETAPADLVTAFAEPGLHAVAMQSTTAFSDLPALRFNDYAKEEGLTPILVARKRAGKMNTPGRERYSRRAKVLLQVGAPTPANQLLATRAVGLKLEIVPERNPYMLGASRMLPVRVMYQGKRLPGALVKLTNLQSDAKPFATAITDRNGRATFRVPASGDWLLNVLWSQPVTGDPKIDFDTTFSSLTFGYGRAGR